jgi:predicted nucleic acid-binding Zn ribbon protein
MAQYAYRCAQCGTEDDQEFPIGTARRVQQCACGGVLRLVIGAGVNISHAGFVAKGSRVREVDNREKGWDRDMPAYKRMRRRGMQPPGIDGASQLEDRVNDNLDLELTRPGLQGVSRERLVEAKEIAADAQRVAKYG